MKISPCIKTEVDVSERLSLFDLSELSPFDGPGLRTVVFFQGCPLSCAWCHSPHSQSTISPLLFHEIFCTHCGFCVSACPHGVHEMVGEEHIIHREKCIHCGQCVAACPQSREGVKASALFLPTVQSDVHTLFEQIRPYLDLTKRSGGGITLSGGEPLLQSEAAMKLLWLCKAHGYHTAVESSGLMPLDRYKLLIPWVDVWLIGFRVTTGEVPPSKEAQVDRCLSLLHDAKAKILPRIPIIPGFTNQTSVLEVITRLLNKYHLKHVDLNPWNDHFDVNYIHGGMELKMTKPSTDIVEDATREIKDHFKRLNFTIDEK
ncbi:glycyl-radical enzyme activating protein [Halosquirtibacter xylanolyticus]|uniref:glycyl-radical enzyme activating protein n=1 Tax=Halosquirtibacter xylanolyticus TaxID=3374599 RepID=UPI00374A2140|nr:glycyl-radical enzyme activating protein [Prolixibacteraceae bacterium]